MKNIFRWMFPLGLLLLFAVSGVGVWCIYSLRQAVYYEHQSTKLHDKADEIHDLVLAAESSQRGYLLTGKQDDLDSLNEAISDTPQKIDELISLFTLNQLSEQPDNQQTIVNDIRSLVQEKFDELKSTITLRSQNKNSEALKIVDSDRGQSVVLELRSKLNAIKEASKKQSSEKSSFIRNYSTLLMILITFGLLASVFLIILNLLMTKNQVQLREIEKEELSKARALAQESSDLKSKFLATVSHEIRTPLNGIIGLSDVLRKSKLPEAELRFVEVIHGSGKTLLKIINDILDFSRIESGRIELEMSEFDLFEVAHQVIDTLSSKAAEKSISLSCVFDEKLPATIFGDPSRISQVLFNLVGNAVKFTSTGSVILKIKKAVTDQSQISKDQPQAIKINFSVEDTGIGMNRDKMNYLFQPFNQIHKVGTSGEPGSGLGLSISQHLVKAMGGHIEVSSEFDRGSKFWFSLEFRKFSNLKKTPIQKINTSAQIQPLFEKEQRPMVLVAEDNMANQITIQTILNKLGLEVLLASNGQEVIDLCSKTHVDLILMDCQMPVMDGFESSLLLKKSRFQIPIIAMTANASREDEKKCLAAGMDDFLAKPITIDLLSNLLIKYLKPEPSQLSQKILDDLESKIGTDGKTKVVAAFLSVLPELRDSLEKNLSQNDVEQIHRLGHRFKSSTLTVGATGLTYLCRQLEKETEVSKLKLIADSIQEATYKIEKNLSV